MESFVQPPVQNQVALKQGLLYGAAIAVLNILISYISVLTKVTALGIITYLVALVGYFLVGLVASQRTGRVATGLLAGLYAGIVGAIGYIVWSLLDLYVVQPNALSNVHVSNSSLSSSQIQTLAGAGIVILLIFALIVNVAIGLGLGAAGGAVGKGRAKLPAGEYNQGPYQAPPIQQ